MDLQTIRAMVKESLSLQDADDTRVDSFVNEAIVDFARDTRMGAVPFSFQTIAGQDVYAVDGAVDVGTLVRFTIVASGGTLDVGVSGSDEDTVAYDATAAVWEAALEGLTADLGEVDVVVGGGDGSIDTPIIVDVRQQLGAAVTVTDASSLTGNGAAATATTRRLDPTGILWVKPDADVRELLGYTMHAENTSEVILSPVPTRTGDVVTGWLVPRPLVISGDTDLLPFDREWDRAIRYRSMQLGAEWDRQEPGEIQMWEGKYEGEVSKARRSRNRFAAKGTRPFRASSRLHKFSSQWFTDGTVT